MPAPTTVEAGPATSPVAARSAWPPEDPGAQQLGAAGLLLGAGVPYDEEHHHQRDEKGGRAGRLVRRDTAERAHVVRDPVHHLAGAARADRDAVAGSLRRGVVERQHRLGRHRGDGGDAEHPQRQPDPVAAQDQPDQVCGARRALRPHGTGRPVRRSAAGTAPRGSVDGWSASGSPASPSAASASSSWSVSTSKRDAGPSSTCSRSCTPGRASSPVAGRTVSATTEVRVRWRSSASVPVCTVAAAADDAHPVAQRLDLGEDVAGQQHRAALGR